MEEAAKKGSDVGPTGKEAGYCWIFIFVFCMLQSYLVSRPLQFWCDPEMLDFSNLIWLLHEMKQIGGKWNWKKTKVVTNFYKNSEEKHYERAERLQYIPGKHRGVDISTPTSCQHSKRDSSAHSSQNRKLWENGTSQLYYKTTQSK